MSNNVKKTEALHNFRTYLNESKSFQKGKFTLSSGKESDYYIDLRKIPSNMNLFKELTELAINEINEKEFDSEMICGIATGGLVFATSIATKLNMPLIYYRQTQKDYGLKKSIEGNMADKVKILIIDDVSTTGSSIIKAAEILRDKNLIVENALVIFDRLEEASNNLSNNNIKLHSLFNIKDIKNEN